MWYCREHVLCHNDARAETPRAAYSPTLSHLIINVTYNDWNINWT